LNLIFHTHMTFVFLFCSIHKPGIELGLSRITRLHPRCNDNEAVTPDEDDDDDMHLWRNNNHAVNYHVGAFRVAAYCKTRLGWE